MIAPAVLCCRRTVRRELCHTLSHETIPMSLSLDVHAELHRGAFTLKADFQVPQGLTVLLGPSGAGKSLTLQAIAGLLPLEGGRIVLRERVLADAAMGVALAPGLRGVGYVPQASALFTHLSVAENVAYALPRPPKALPWGAQVWRAEHARRVAELLAMVRLPGFERRATRTLSGGEAQRVALARALAADPRALLLDEPLSALDAPTRAALQEDLRAVVLASGVVALVVTHDLAEARALADRLVVLVGGCVVAQGLVADVLAAPTTATTARLLGWSTLLPVSALHVADEETVVMLAGGQHVTIPTTRETSRLVPSQTLLALHPDRLLLASAAPGATDPRLGDADVPVSRLVGTLAAKSDMGAFFLPRIALDGAPAEASLLTVTCSPREWAATGLAVGAQVAVLVAADAARLVAG